MLQIRTAGAAIALLLLVLRASAQQLQSCDTINPQLCNNTANAHKSQLMGSACKNSPVPDPYPYTGCYAVCCDGSCNSTKAGVPEDWGVPCGKTAKLLRNSSKPSKIGSIRSLTSPRKSLNCGGPLCACNCPPNPPAPAPARSG